jgi:hypothetical protein
MDATTVFAVLGLITALAYVGNPFNNNNYDENKQNGGGKKTRKRVNKGNHKSRKL